MDEAVAGVKSFVTVDVADSIVTIFVEVTNVFDVETVVEAVLTDTVVIIE